MKKTVRLLASITALVVMTATPGCGKNDPDTGPETVTDYDGNTYKTIKIGDQIWMAENLKVTHLNDGAQIPRVSDAGQWTELTSEAYCSFDNSQTLFEGYGALYNWYAVGSGMLAPKGWHVPSVEDWDELIDYLIANGYSLDESEANLIAKAMASTTSWTMTTTAGTPGNTDYPEYRNKSGFNALSAGVRFSTGIFGLKGESCRFWASDPPNPGEDGTSCYKILFDGTAFSQSHNFLKSGLSIRCIKD